MPSQCALRLASALLALAAFAPSLLAQSFQGIGIVPNGTACYTYGVSANGQVAFGLSERAFRWTAAAGIEDLGVMPGGVVTLAEAASADGSVIVGYGDSSGPFYTAFRWTRETGVVSLGTIGATSHAFGVSASGDWVVGQYLVIPTAERHAFRWSAATGMEDIDSPGGSALAASVSNDGSVVAGYNGQAFRWTRETGITELGVLPGGTISTALAVSADGSAILGWSATDLSGGSISLFRWTAATGMVDIGDLGNITSFSGYAMSADGSVIVGNNVSGAIMWTQQTGLVDLSVYLRGLGLDLSGWDLTNATGVSADGRTIVGNANHNARTEAWVAVLPPLCPADFNRSGSLSVQDIFDFLGAWFAGSPSANFNNANGLEVQDIFDFLGAWFSGC